MDQVKQRLMLMTDKKNPCTDAIPDSFYQQLLESLMERNYLANTADMKFLNFGDKKVIHWMQITRLPVHPNENESYDLIARWQGVLTSLHAWNYRLYFLLLRHDGKTKLFLGTASSTQQVSAQEAVEQLREATFGSMPGMGLRVLGSENGVEEAFTEIKLPLRQMNAIGAVTGIPSFRSEEKRGMLQTLDQLAFGIRDAQGSEKDYAMLVIADPIADEEIAGIIARYRRLGSEIHTAVKMSSSHSVSGSEQGNPNANLQAGGQALGTIAGALGIQRLAKILGEAGGSMVGNPMLGAMIGGQIAGALTAGFARQQSEGSSSSVSGEYLNKMAEYAEKATDHHVERLSVGRNFGFWNTGVYVLGGTQRDVITVGGMLRSIYSGDNTYYEPIRLHLFSDESNAREIVRNNLDLLPMVDQNLVEQKLIEARNYAEFRSDWHPMGRHYQYLSTPMNTCELSLATSLPRRDVPGLRFVKTAVRFANNPASVKKENKITLGNIVDMGVVQGTAYDLDIHSLVRHGLVSGGTGSGKSTTCRQILMEVIRRDIPVLVIEPAKDDYVRWALNMNKTLPKEKQFKIYMPGVTNFEGHELEPLHINLFEPAAVPDVEVDLLSHCEAVTTLLNACLPAEEIVPILIEETMHEMIGSFAEANRRDIEQGPVERMNSYPMIYPDLMLKAASVMNTKSYADINKDNIREMLITRFKHLRRGTRGKILNVRKSVDYNALFTGNVIINISRLSGTKDKSLIMSLLMQALYEYRISRYTCDDAYRKGAQENKLMHLALIEEAHNMLLKPDPSERSGSPQRAAADIFANMLSEVRGYGQGFLVVDQIPNRLIEDVVKNTNYKIVHRLTAPDDQEVMASCMALRDDQKYIIPALETGNAIICGDQDDAAVWVRITPPSEQQTHP